MTAREKGGTAVGIAALRQVHRRFFTAGVAEGDVQIPDNRTCGDQQEAAIGRPVITEVAIDVAVDLPRRQRDSRGVGGAIPDLETVAIVDIGDAIAIRGIGWEQQVNLAGDELLLLQSAGGGEAGAALGQGHLKDFGDAAALAAIQQAATVRAVAEMLLKGRGAGDAPGETAAG